MEKCGDIDDCISTAEATELATRLDKEKVNNLPVPGQVDFINGGPPCQVFIFHSCTSTLFHPYSKLFPTVSVIK